MSDHPGYLVNEVFHSVQGEGHLAGTAMVFVRLSKCNMRCAMEPGLRSPGGFDCDTEYESGRRMGLDELLDVIVEERDQDAPWPEGDVHWDAKPWVLLTGGEPALQVDRELLQALRYDIKCRIAIETNGSIELPRLTGELLDSEVGGGLSPAGWQRRFRGEDIEESDEEYWRRVVRQYRSTEPRALAETMASAYGVDHITVSPKVAEHAVRQLFAHELRYVRGHGQGMPQPQCLAVHRYLSPATQGDSPDPRAAAWCARLVRENPEWRVSVQQHKVWKVR